MRGDYRCRKTSSIIFGHFAAISSQNCHFSLNFFKSKRLLHVFFRPLRGTKRTKEVLIVHCYLRSLTDEKHIHMRCHQKYYFLTKNIQILSRSCNFSVNFLYIRRFFLIFFGRFAAKNEKKS